MKSRSTKRQKQSTSQNGDSSSSSLGYDSAKFTSLAAFERYRDKIIKKRCLPERGINPEGTEMEEEIQRREWEEFVKSPPSACINIVQEFYANAPEHDQNHKVFVRGKMVPFGQESINNLFNLDNRITQKEYEALPTDEETKHDIISSLTDGTAEWPRNKPARHFLTSHLAREKKAWHQFISDRLLPTSHVTEVTLERAKMIFAICRGYALNIGQIIHQSILDTIHAKAATSLGHPSVIHALCVNAGVRFEPTEPVCDPMPPIDRNRVASYKKKAVAEQPQDQELPQHPALIPPPDPVQAMLQQITQSMNRLLRRQDRMHAINEMHFQRIEDVLREIHPTAASRLQDLELPSYPPTDEDTTN